MSLDPNQPNWLYLAGVEVKGPVSLNEISRLIVSGEVSGNILLSTREQPKWRPAPEVLREVSGGPLPNPPSPSPTGSGGTISLAEDLLHHIGETLTHVAGTEKLEGFSVQEMFSETFKHRTVADMEEYLIVGTERTTPPISEVQTGWPKPWLFARFLTFFGLVYFGFVFAYQHFENPNLIPGLILMGSSAVPIATLILFFELNTPRNVSLYRIMILLGLGGMVSLCISLIGYDIAHLNWLGASSAGIIEELGKLAALILIVHGGRYKYILNGMLLGAAVGAGFAAFESAGYAFRIGLTYGSHEMLENIALRGLLAPLMHVSWTAIVGAALWRVKKDQVFEFHMLVDPTFYPVLLLVMSLHMFWNSPLLLPLYLKEIALGAVAWFVISGLVQQGLRQVQNEQRAAAARESAAQAKVVG